MARYMNPAVEDAIRQRFAYDPDTGKLTKDGTVNHSYRNGYRLCYIGVDCKEYTLSEHRVAFFLMTGRWPGLLDHKNRIKDDNRWNNLREATPAQNAQNRIPPKKSNLPRGVYYRSDANRIKRYAARIRLGNSEKNLGTFLTAKEASEAYESAFDTHIGAEWRPHGNSQSQETHIN